MEEVNRLIKIQSLLATEYQRGEKERRKDKRVAHKARREAEKEFNSLNKFAGW